MGFQWVFNGFFSIEKQNSNRKMREKLVKLKKLEEIDLNGLVKGHVIDYCKTSLKN
jgi:thiamine biosynthesis lipoprotein ApbE